MKVVTSAEMRAVDKEAIEECHIPSLMLMENAGTGAADGILRRLGGAEGKRIVVVCGKGNNGGDGLVVARHLLEAGAGARVFLLARRGDLSKDASENLERLMSLGAKPDALLDEGALGRLAKALESADLAVDALFGTGFTGAAGGVAAGAIEVLNGSAVPVIAIDIPSGLDADTGRAEGVCVRAAATYTMALLKRGLTLYPGRMYAGDVEVVDIGVPDSVITSMNLAIEALDSGWAHDHLPLRRPDAHKGDCGHVLVVGGSAGLTGAVALASRAAMRAGAGLVTAAVPRVLNAILEMKLTEPMTAPVDETTQGTIAASAEADLLEWIKRTDVLLLGPGMSRVPETEGLARRLVLAAGGPTILDADGLNAFEGRGDELARVAGALIITPHPGEMARLAGVPVAEQEKDRIGTALAAAERFRCIVVYKGAPTVIAGPDGRAFLNPTGNAGMATGGSGDVLSGIIAGLLAQGCAVFEGAALGVYLHGLAGDLAARQLGIWSLLAGDMIEALPDAMVDVWKHDEESRDEDDGADEGDES